MQTGPRAPRRNDCMVETRIKQGYPRGLLKAAFNGLWGKNWCCQTGFNSPYLKK